MDSQAYRLRELMTDESRFLCGVELVTTRGTMGTAEARRIRALSSDLVSFPHVHWVSITDNAGGNPMLSPMALGKPILYGGKKVIIHLSCKDFNRNGLESEAWSMASEGFHNILALSGDYPVSGYRGPGKPVFDTDSVGLLTMLKEMNAGLGVASVKNGRGDAKNLDQTDFFVGAAATNFKRHESEVVPQYLKLEKKVASGAEFIIPQIGFDARKSSEMKVYMERHGMGHVPLFGNVYLLSGSVARFFNTGRIPGVTVTERLREICTRQAQSPDKGKAFFLEFAAKQMAITRGLGNRGVYLGGVHCIDDIANILEIEKSFGEGDWKEFVHEIDYSEEGTFYYYAADPATGLSDGDHLEPSYAKSLQRRKRNKNVTLGYRINRLVHDWVFSPNKGLHSTMKRIYARHKDSMQGPAMLRGLEHASKSLLFRCQDCGDCSLPDTAFLCPESQCAKNQRNGPCGGTRDGLCEVSDLECIWSRAYDRLKWEGHEERLLSHAPVIQDQGLRGTSSWRNAILEEDHRGAHEMLEFSSKRGEKS